MLYDVWHDYPNLVIKYRKERKIKDRAFWKPSATYMSEMKRIMGYSGKGNDRIFITLWQNGYTDYATTLKTCEDDAPHLLEEYCKKNRCR